MGMRSIERDDPDAIPLLLLNDILGGSGFTSRIMQQVRSNEGLAYSAASAVAPKVDYPGQFQARFESKNATVALATKILLDLRGKLPSDARSPYAEWVPQRPDQKDLERLDAIHSQWREKYVLSGAGPCKYYFGNGEYIRAALKLPATGGVDRSSLTKARVNRQKEVRAKFLELFAIKFGVGFGSYMDNETVRNRIDEGCPGFVGPCSGYREFVSKKRKAHDITKFYSVWYDAMEQNRGTYAEFCNSYFSPDHNIYDGKDVTTTDLFEYVSRVSINSRAPAIRSRFVTEASR